MDSTAFSMGAVNASQIINYLRLPDTGNLIQITYLKTYTFNPTGNTMLTITVNGIVYTFDFATANNTSNTWNGPFDMTKE